MYIIVQVLYGKCKIHTQVCVGECNRVLKLIFPMVKVTNYYILLFYINIYTHRRTVTKENIKSREKLNFCKNERVER